MYGHIIHNVISAHIWAPSVDKAYVCVEFNYSLKIDESPVVRAQ